MGFFDRLFGKRDTDNDIVAGAEKMLAAKVDEAHRLRGEMATRLVQLENRMKELDFQLRRPDVEGIRRRQAEEDFDRAARAIAVSQKEAKLLDQSLRDAEDSWAKVRELAAGRTQGNEADVLVKLKIAMEGYEQSRQLTSMAMADLRSTELSVDAGTPVDPVTEEPTPAVASPPAATDESQKAAERQQRMAELLGPMKH